jgi:hypothetical protein
MELSNAFHERATTIQRIRRQQQMNVICHQAMRMQRAARLSEEAAQMKEIKAAVAFLVEAGLSVISALNDVYRNAGQHDASAARHGS